jgi:microcystin-dependent protein
MAQFYVGQIVTGGWSFAPSGTALCNGQLQSIAQNQALFAVIGTIYGGDGVQTFGLPDLQGRRMNHWGQGPGLATYGIGERSGVEQVTLLQGNLPQHTHTITSSLNASTVKATQQDPSAGAVLGHAVDIASGGTAKPAIYAPSGSATSAALGGLNVSAGLSGNNLPLQILNPFLTITIVMSLFGIFPSRN